MPFNLGFHTKCILNLWCMLFHPAWVMLMGFEMLLKNFSLHFVEPVVLLHKRWITALIVSKFFS